MARQQTTPRISPDACSAIVRAFDEQGWHRTATRVDQLSAEWLVGELSAAGIAAETVAFPFSRVDAVDSSVHLGELEIPAIALMDSGLPAVRTAIRGQFRPGSIGLVRVVSHGVATEVEQLRAGSNDALVVAVAGPPGGITLLNAWNFDSPGGIPVVQVSEDAWPALEAAREAGKSITVSCGGPRTDTEAMNVFAQVPGTRPGKAPLGVLTPRSGWWNCASERGGGIAIWLEVARVAAQLGFERDLIFLATSGHELGFLGARRYFEREPGLARQARAWIHLGANIGAAGSQLVVRASDAGLLATARQQRELLDISPAPRFEVTNRPVGEAGEVLQRGGTFISLVGGEAPLFHSTLDRWPGAIDAPAIASAANGVLHLLSTLDAEP